MRKVLGAFVIVLLAAAGGHAAIVPIEEVKEITLYGDPVSYGQRVTVSGVVTVGSGIFNPESSTLDAYIQDRTAGINIYTSAIKGIQLVAGDSVVVSSTLPIHTSTLPPNH